MRIFRPLFIGCLAMAISATLIAQPAPPPTLQQPDEVNVDWSEWLADHGTTAVVIWASWLPKEERNIRSLTDIQRAANSKGLDFVVIALQEPIETSRKALGPSGLPWLHDRHGAMLQHLLVYQVPALVVLQKDGTVLARLHLGSEALVDWTNAK